VGALAIGLALTSACIHASWNALLKGGRDRLVDSFLLGLGGLAPSLAIMATWGAPAPAAWPYLGISCLVHLVYWFALLKGYEAGELSHIYTLSRGVAPVLVAVGAALTAREVPGAFDLAGIGLISIGVMSIGLSRTAPWRASAWALGIGACISTYSLIDALGARASGSALIYVGWDTALMSVALIVFAVTRRGAGVVRDAFAAPWRGLGVGVISMAGYGLVLWAQTLAPIAQVTALRETSVVFGVLIAALFLGERVSARRWAGAGLAALGAALIGFG